MMGGFPNGIMYTSILTTLNHFPASLMTSFYMIFSPLIVGLVINNLVAFCSLFALSLLFSFSLGFFLIDVCLYRHIAGGWFRVPPQQSHVELQVLQHEVLL